jgi:hypothetical protein
MSADTVSDTPNPDVDQREVDATPTALQAAIRARAMATLENAARQYQPTVQRRLVTGAMVLAIMLLLITSIDFGVRILHRMFIIWYGDPDAPLVQPAPFDPSKPMFITVDPAQDAKTPKPSTPDASRDR